MVEARAGNRVGLVFCPEKGENRPEENIMSTILLFDAGNTNTKICLADDQGLGESYTLPTRPANTADDWGLKIESILQREEIDPQEIEACVISSGGARPWTRSITHMAQRFLGCEPVFAGRDLPLDLENEYAPAREGGRGHPRRGAIPPA